jgi:hypothetical protein
MDALSFVSSIINSLAWPAALIFFVWYLRQPLAELLLTVTRFRYKDLEIDFARELRDVKAAAEKELPPAKEAEARVLAVSPSAKSQVEEIAKVDPSAAVLVAWRQVEQALSRAARRSELAPPWPALGVIRMLFAREVIDRPTYEIFNELRRLRNQAAHTDGPEITESQAIDFGDLALRLAAKIDEVSNNLSGE